MNAHINTSTQCVGALTNTPPGTHKHPSMHTIKHTDIYRKGEKGVRDQVKKFLLCVCVMFRCVTAMGTATVIKAGHHPSARSQDSVAVWTVGLSSMAVSIQHKLMP